MKTRTLSQRLTFDMDSTAGYVGINISPHAGSMLHVNGLSTFGDNFTTGTTINIDPFLDASYAGIYAEKNGAYQGMTFDVHDMIFRMDASSGVGLALTNGGDAQILRNGRGIILNNAAGTLTKRVRLNDTGDGLIFEAP